jgi:hypothetical protein
MTHAGYVEYLYTRPTSYYNSSSRFFVLLIIILCFIARQLFHRTYPIDNGPLTNA